MMRGVVSRRALKVSEVTKLRVLVARRCPMPEPSASSNNFVQIANGFGSGVATTMAVASLRFRSIYGGGDVLRKFYGPSCGVRWIRCPHLPGIDRHYWSLVGAVAKQTDAYAYVWDPSLASHLVSKGVTVVLELHHPYPPKRVSHLRKAASSAKLALIVGISRSVRQWTKLALGADWEADRMVVAADGIGPCRLKAFQEAARPGYDRRPIVGYCGSLIPGKGAELIPEIARRLPTVRFEIVGGRTQDFGTLVDGRRPQNLHHVPWTPPARIPERLVRWALGLLPNQSRVVLKNGIDIGPFTSPLKLFEYMAAGLPIVASDLPVIREVLNGSRCSLLVDPQSVGAWAGAIQGLLEDEEKRMQMGSAGRYLVERRYTYSRRCSDILDRIA